MTQHISGGRGVEDAQTIYAAAVRAVQADRLFDGIDLAALTGAPLDSFRAVRVVGAGKAAMAMAGALEALLPRAVEAGLVVVPHGYRATLPASQRAPARIEVVEAGHPVPDAAGVAAARRTLEIAEACGADELLLVLISGGGSALWPAPAPGITLDAAQETFRLLLRSGAAIHAVNTVRKQLSRIKGGRLAVAAAPATVVALVLSDVIGDDLAVIASGPTVPDHATAADAVRVLRAFDLWEVVPESVRAHLEAAETPKPGNSDFSHTKTILLGSNRTALDAAYTEATARGYTARLVAGDLSGEAREVGRDVARHVLEAETQGPMCLLWGGETTVTVTGHGTGGRNQELALGAALALDGSDRRAVVLSGGTDGRDGPTDAAGAWATPATITEACRRGLDPAAALADNDAYPFFERLGALLRPGPTHTNVMDVIVALVE